MNGSSVLVLNSDYNQINVISWRRAFSLIEKGKVEIVHYTDKTVRNWQGDFEFRIPLVIRLVNFVKQVYARKLKFSKKYVKIRDSKTCMYCGAKEKKMTIDHVVPISKGGKNTWENCVCCCHKCNNKKGNKLLQETDTRLKKLPHAPTVREFLKLKMDLSGIKIEF